MATSKIERSGWTIHTHENVSDLNNAVESGFYLATGSTSNTPLAGTSMSVLVICTHLVIHQIAFIGNYCIYMRRKSGAAWNEWKSISF